MQPGTKGQRQDHPTRDPRNVQQHRSGFCLVVLQGFTQKVSGGTPVPVQNRLVEEIGDHLAAAGRELIGVLRVSGGKFVNDLVIRRQHTLCFT